MFAPPHRRDSAAGSRRDAALLRKHNFAPTYPVSGRPGGESHES
jgi:hypothetical protein